MNIAISGIGWVYTTSMGYKGDIKVLPSSKHLPSIERKDIFKEPYKPFGRMDYFSKLGVSAIVFAMKDANLHGSPNKNTSIIASSSTGCLETDIKYQATLFPENNTLPSPALFAYTLPSCFLGEASIRYGLTGESFVISETYTTGMTGLGMAVDLLAAGQTDYMLCGINNSQIDGVDDATICIQPGAVFFLLEKKKRNMSGSYGKLSKNESNNSFYYEDSPINNLYDLAQKCLKKNI
jgi:3-oxoacyl-[acyl-carrier-protein] synthase II